MTTEAETTQRRLSETVRDMLNEYRLQAHAGPVGDKALEEILFRAAHGVVQSLATYSGPQRVALLPHVVHMLLATFLEEIAATDQAHLSRRPPGGGPMIAALYARKSTESNVSAEAKSVVLQQDVARAFAVRHGWTVADERLHRRRGQWRQARPARPECPAPRGAVPRLYTATARQVLRQLMVGRFTLTPRVSGKARWYDVTGLATYGSFFRGLPCVVGLVPPA